MKIDELINKLKSEPLLEKEYCIGDFDDNRECIMKENDEWIIFFYERGSRNLLKKFTNEEEACNAFYERLMRIKNRMLK